MMTACSNAQNRTEMVQNETLENLKTRRAIRSYTDSVPSMELIR